MAARSFLEKDTKVGLTQLQQDRDHKLEGKINLETKNRRLSENLYGPHVSPVIAAFNFDAYSKVKKFREENIVLVEKAKNLEKTNLQLLSERDNLEKENVSLNRQCSKLFVGNNLLKREVEKLEKELSILRIERESQKQRETRKMREFQIIREQSSSSLEPMDEIAEPLHKESVDDFNPKPMSRSLLRKRVLSFSSGLDLQRMPSAEVKRLQLENDQYKLRLANLGEKVLYLQGELAHASGDANTKPIQLESPNAHSTSVDIKILQQCLDKVLDENVYIRCQNEAMSREIETLNDKLQEIQARQDSKQESVNEINSASEITDGQALPPYTGKAEPKQSVSPSVTDEEIDTICNKLAEIKCTYEIANGSGLPEGDAPEDEVFEKNSDTLVTVQETSDDYDCKSASVSYENMTSSVELVDQLRERTVENSSKVVVEFESTHQDNDPQGMSSSEFTASVVHEATGDVTAEPPANESDNTDSTKHKPLDNTEDTQLDKVENSGRENLQEGWESSK